MSLALPFLAALASTVILVPLVGRIARTYGFYARPTYDRWNRRPVPNVGGIAMAVPLLFVLGISELLKPLEPIVAGATAMFVLGLIDDLRPFRPGTKLIGQMAVAALMLWLLPPVRITGIGLVDVALEFVWIVGITNAVNLLDNIDGLAAGVAGIAGAAFLSVLVLDGSVASMPLAAGMAAFVGVTAGFLFYNFHPASIFMGDGGSHLLGAFLAGATLAAIRCGHAADVGAMVAAIPFVLLLIPIFDTAFVTLARRIAGRSAFLGGRDHTSHRLVALGIGERRAVVVLYALTALGGAVAFGLLTLSGITGVCVSGAVCRAARGASASISGTSRSAGS